MCNEWVTQGIHIYSLNWENMSKLTRCVKISWSTTINVISSLWWKLPIIQITWYINHEISTDLCTRHSFPTGSASGLGYRLRLHNDLPPTSSHEFKSKFSIMGILLYWHNGVYKGILFSSFWDEGYLVMVLTRDYQRTV